MKKIETNDWIIIQSFGAPVRFADGTIAIYGSEREAQEDALYNDIVIQAISAPAAIKSEITDQINA